MTGRSQFRLALRQQRPVLHPQDHSRHALRILASVEWHLLATATWNDTGDDIDPETEIAVLIVRCCREVVIKQQAGVQ